MALASAVTFSADSGWPLYLGIGVSIITIILGLMKVLPALAHGVRIMARLDTALGQIMGGPGRPGMSDRLESIDDRMARVEAELPPNGQPLAVKIEAVRQQAVANGEAATTAATAAVEASRKFDVVAGRQEQTAVQVSLLVTRLETTSGQVDSLRATQAAIGAHLDTLLTEALTERAGMKQSIADLAEDLRTGREKVWVRLETLKGEIEQTMSERAAAAYELLAEHGGPDLRLPPPAKAASRRRRQVTVHTESVDEPDEG